MDIWTERLERDHLPLLAPWLGREKGALTPHDLPAGADALAAWFERCSREPGRLDCLARVYETPVGIAGLKQQGNPDEAALYLFLGEVNYNPSRTATYVTLRMLDRAFSDLWFKRVSMQVHADFRWFAEVLEQMGFSRTAEEDGPVRLAVEKDVFQSRKYLF